MVHLEKRLSLLLLPVLRGRRAMVNIWSLIGGGRLQIRAAIGWCGQSGYLCGGLIGQNQFTL